MSPTKKAKPTKAEPKRAAPEAAPPPEAPPAEPTLSTVHVRLSGFEVDPDVVTSRLGVVPSLVLRAGEPLSPDSRQNSRVNVWELAIEQANAKEGLGDVLARLLQLVDLDQVRGIRETFSGSLEVSFQVRGNASPVGLVLDPDIVGRLAQAGAGFDVNIRMASDAASSPKRATKKSAAGAAR